jgi:hypothetical protein
VATFVAAAGSHPYPAGTTVSVYPDLGQKPEGVPRGDIAAIDDDVVASNGTLTFIGITESARYYMVGQVAGAYRWMIFRGHDLSTSDQLASHESDTTNVHGIADTSLLLTVTGGAEQDVVHVREHGITPSSSASFNDGAIIEAIADAEERRTSDGTIMGTVLQFGQGSYDFADEIEAGGCSISGAGISATMLRWPSDTGAGTYGIKASAGFQAAYYRDLTLRGGANNPGLGWSPRDQDGIRLPEGCWMVDVRVEGFRRGVQGYGSHWGLVRCQILQNQDGVDWGLAAQPNKADQRILSCKLDGNYRSSIAVPYGDRIASATIFDTHLGFCPIGIYGYDDGSGVTEPVMIIGSKFIQCSIESCGNAFILEDAATKKQRILDSHFEIQTILTNDSNFYLASESRDYQIDVATFSNNVVEDLTGYFIGASGEVGAVRATTDGTGNTFHVPKATIQSVYPKKLFSDDSFAARTAIRMRDTADGKAVMRKATAAITNGDVLGSANVFPATCRPWQDGDVYLGVALATVDSGEWVPIAVEGDNINVNTIVGQFDTSPGGQFYGIPDVANPGKMRVLPNGSSTTSDLGSIADGGQTTFDLNCHGARLGDAYAASMSLDAPDGVFLTARPRAANTVQVTVHNESGSAYDPGSATYRCVPVGVNLPLVGWGYLSLSAGTVATTRLVPGGAAA